MKKIIHFPIILIVLLVLTLTGCEKSFNDLKQNNNLPQSAPPSLLFNGILNDMYDRPFLDDHPLTEKWDQYFLGNYTYYGNNRYDFGEGANYYFTLKNVVKMEEEANTEGLPSGNVYDALGKFFKAYFFTKMSLEMGDIPMTEALKGLDNLTPAYDRQKDIFLQAFAWLDSANIELKTLINIQDANLAGDIYYGNNLESWQKAVNTFRLRLLIHLSKKADDADLKVKQQFDMIVNNPDKYPVFTGPEDDLKYTYLYPTNLYPTNPGNFGYNALRLNCSDTYVSLLTKLKDPRVYITSEPAAALFDSLNPLSFSAFIGANPGEDLGVMNSKTVNGQYSLLNRYHYYRTYTGEPTLEISYAEMCFNIAEAINRGWITSGPLGDAEAYYKEGIMTSWAFYGIPQTGTMDVHFFKSGAGIADANPYNTYTANVDFDTYYSQDSVAYNGNNPIGLREILQQRYISLFRHEGLESYFMYRRTGVPTFETGPGTGNSERIAMRFQYPATEKTTNIDNMNAALKAQGFGNNDDINGKMWLLK